MKILAALFLMVSLAAHAQLGAHNIAKERAKRANESNNAEQQRIANAAADPTHPNAAAPAAPGDPVREATLKNIADLQADFTAFSGATNATVDATHKAALLNDLSAAALGTKPASVSVKKLADHLIAATSGKKNPAAQRLARNVHALFNARHLTAAQQTLLLAEVKKNLTAAGAAAAEAENVFDDLKGIVEETK
jgi:hypothetical protein